MSNDFDPDRGGQNNPEKTDVLVPNCLQRLTADDKSRRS